MKINSTIKLRKIQIKNYNELNSKLDNITKLKLSILFIYKFNLIIKFIMIIIYIYIITYIFNYIVI